MRILIILSLVILSISCGGGNTPSSTSVNGDTTCPPTHGATTAQNICLPKVGCGQDCQIARDDGGYISFETGVPMAKTELRKKIQDRVIAGFKQTIRSAQYKYPDWRAYMATGNYNVYMIKKHGSSQEGWPTLTVGGIKTAGTVINIFNTGQLNAPLYVILAEPDNWEAVDDGYWAYLQAASRHEGEHVVEYANAFGVFKSFLGAGDIHPHIPLPPGEEIVGLKALAAPVCAGVDYDGPVWEGR